MNVLFYYQSVSLGGQQTQILNLCREFAQMGHSVIWVFEAGDRLVEAINRHGKALQLTLPGNMPLKPGNKFVRGILFMVKTLVRVLKLKRYTRENKVDLVITSDSYGSLICGLACLRRHTRQFRLIGQDIETLEHFWYNNYRLLHIDSFVDGYFGWPKVYASLRKNGVADAKLADFQANAVDTTAFHPLSITERTRFRRGLGLPEDHIVIGWSGRLEERMQVKHTLMLAKVLKDSGFENFAVLVVGGGAVTADGKEDDTYPAKLRALSVHYGIAERTVFTGWVPHHAINSYINAMDIVPLLEQDPHGGSILREAMACGRVALSVDGPSGTQKCFMPNNCSILVSSKNYIEEAAARVVEFIKNPALLELMGARAREYCLKDMSFRRQAESILNHFGCP
jgi:glycosyltransferase involved in cell wall biosynthesis